MAALSPHFPFYTDYATAVPVHCVTPGVGRVFHRFFDTSPFSPSGRFLALTRMPAEDRVPDPGEPAQVVLVDLETGEERVVAETRGWDTQLGAQAQWGRDDTQLFYNDMDTSSWRPFGVRMDPASGEVQRLDGTVYMVSPDGKYAASPCLLRTGATQAGYGVITPEGVPPVNSGAADDDGIYVTDTTTGACRLLVSFRDILEQAVPAYDSAQGADGDLYGFHVKWTPAGDRMMFVVRSVQRGPGARLVNNVVTLAADGTDIRLAITGSLWSRGGHHPNWCPDGRHVMMNLKYPESELRFVRAAYDGTGLGTMTDCVLGSGHPSLHPNGRHIVTDSYVGEPVAFGDGTTPIRLVDLETGQETMVARVRTQPPYEGPKRVLRVDPHPAWDRSFRRVAFNACPDGTRRVYVADLSDVVGP